MTGDMTGDMTSSISTKALSDIPVEEILAELGDSPLARMLLEAIEANRDMTTWLEQCSREATGLAVEYDTRHAAIVTQAADAGAPEWKARARASAQLAGLYAPKEAAADERTRALEAVRSRREELPVWAALVALRPTRPAPRRTRRTPARRSPPTQQP